MENNTYILEIENIDEFKKCSEISREEVDKTEIIKNVRALDEKSELEPFINSIIHNPNKTPHGPMEIADIIFNLHINGKAYCSTFVIKGKSFPKITLKDIANQIIKPIIEIRDLNIFILVAAGNIQDDVKEAIEGLLKEKIRYLIIDAIDIARLLIVHGFLCPCDGSVYNEKGFCKNGHSFNESRFFKNTDIEDEYDIINQKDLNFAQVKRYSANILIYGNPSKNRIKQIILNATKKLISSNYYSSENAKNIFNEKRADVVWLNVMRTMYDIELYNWMCRTCWINSNLDKSFRPGKLNGNDKIEDIDILWNKDYESNSDYFKKSRGTKENIINEILPEKNKLQKIMNIIIKNFYKIEKNLITEENFIEIVRIYEKEENKIYDNLLNSFLPPYDCKDYFNLVQSFASQADNIFLLYSSEGLKKWKKEDRNWLVKNSIDDIKNILENIRYEEKKIYK